LSKSQMFIQMYIKTAEKHIDNNLKLNEEIIFDEWASDMTLEVIGKLAFGDGLNKTLDYLKQDGTIMKISIYQAIKHLFIDKFDSAESLLNNLFPFYLENHLGHQNRTIRKNHLLIEEKIKEHFEELLKGPDVEEPTEYPQIQTKNLRKGLCTMKEAVDDCIGIIFAGHDTTSHALIASIYYARKNSDMRTKILEEVTQHIFNGDKSKTYKDLKDHLKLEHLN
jgi:cytochrome P450